jgi:hypothetical protein
MIVDIIELCAMPLLKGEAENGTSNHERYIGT